MVFRSRIRSPTRMAVWSACLSARYLVKLGELSCRELRGPEVARPRFIREACRLSAT